MRTAVADTSIDAYYDHAISKAAGQYAKILAVMRPGLDYSLRELERLTGIPTATLSARINEMRAAGTIEQAPKRKCRCSNITVRPSRLPMPKGQGELFQ